MFEDICKMDVMLKPNEISYLRGNQISGVYTLFIKKVPMYVGLSDNIYSRLYTHINKNFKKTSPIMNDVDEIGIQFFNERYSNDLGFLEMAYITLYNPPLNERRGKWYLSRYLKGKYKKTCKHPSNYYPDEQCKRAAHENGYCSWHGGNGITAEILANKEATNFDKNNIQMKLII